MGNEVQKIKMRNANNRPQPMSMSFLHHGTTDFFKPQVIHCQAVNPGETVDLTTIVKIKGKPMMMPGEIQIKHHLNAFWVPNFATHKDWFAFRTNLPFKLNNSYAKHEEDYFTYNNDLVKLFFWTSTGVAFLNYTSGAWHWYTTAIDPDTNPTKYDLFISFFDGNGSGNNTFKGVLGINLTNQGRILYNLLQQLGYEINWQVPINRTLFTADWENWTTKAIEDLIDKQGAEAIDLFNTTDLHMSSRPIINFLKIMIDYYVPPQYENNFQQKLDEILENDYTTGWPDVTMGKLGGLLVSLATWINYDVDRFTGAWKKPQGPNDSSTGWNIKDKTLPNETDNVKSRVTINTNGTTPIITRADGSEAVRNLTDYILRALDAVQNFTTRNRIAGYRPIDRFLAHFGKRIDYIHTKRAQYIDGSHNNLTIIDVTSMAEDGATTPGATGINDAKLLGGIAAKASGGIQLNTKWTADDDGWIFIIDTVIPRVGYFQGMKNHILRTNWRDLYNPEFDNLGTQPIRRCELFSNSEGKSAILNFEQIWGYEPTYMGMKCGWDTKSGDRRIRTLNTGLNSMDTMRTFNSWGTDFGNSITSDFLRGDNAQYDRIFQYMLGNVDHYYFDALTKDNGAKPMQSVSESLPLTDGEGNVTEWQYGGGNYMQ